MTPIPGLETLFQNFLNYKQTTHPSSFGPWLHHHLTDCPFPSIDQMPFRSGAYTRNRIAKEDPEQNQGFEALIMRWDKQVQTSIHGHPEFSFYHVISGCFGMNVFAHSSTGGLHIAESRRFGPGEAVWFLGQAGRYDNFIHQVTCLEPGHTFHVYSEDAQKGAAFDQLAEHSWGLSCKVGEENFPSQVHCSPVGLHLALNPPILKRS